MLKKRVKNSHLIQKLRFLGKKTFSTYLLESCLKLFLSFHGPVYSDFIICMETNEAVFKASGQGDNVIKTPDGA